MEFSVDWRPGLIPKIILSPNTLFFIFFFQFKQKLLYKKNNSNIFFYKHCPFSFYIETVLLLNWIPHNCFNIHACHIIRSKRLHNSKVFMLKQVYKIHLAIMQQIFFNILSSLGIYSFILNIRE